MASDPRDPGAVPVCRFDASSLMDAIELLAGQLEGLRASVTSLDQKVTQLRTIEHQNLVQTVKQLRGALDMSTRDNKRQIETLSTQLTAATVRIRSLDFALSNQKLDKLIARGSKIATKSTDKRAAETPTDKRAAETSTDKRAAETSTDKRAAETSTDKRAAERGKAGASEQASQKTG